VRFLLALVTVASLLSQSQRLEAYPGSPERMLQEAWLEEEANRDFSAAADLYGQVIKEDPGDRASVARARLGRARCFMQMGKRDAAAAELKTVLDQFQDQAEAVAQAASYLDQLTGGAESPSVVKQRLREAYVKELKSPEQHLRARAAAGLGTLGDPLAVPALVEALDDEDPFVRKSAISSLGSIGDSSALSALVPLLGVRELRPDIARALASIGDSSVIGELLRAVFDEAGLGTYAESLRALWTSDATATLFKLLEDSRPDAKVNWALLLPDLDPAGSLSAMITWLSSPSHQVRAAAATGLGRTADRSATEPLIKALSDPALPVREAACQALGRLEALEAVPYLIDTLEEDNVRLKSAAAHALNQIKDPTSLVPLIAAGNLSADWDIVPAHARFLAQGLAHPSPAARRYCAKMLAGVATPAQQAALATALSDEDPVVRSSVARGLGRLKSRDALPNLAKLLDDPSHSVRIAAAESLGAIGDSEATLYLVDALDDPEPSVQRAVAQAISQIGDPSAAPALKGLLSSDDVELRAIAITAAGRLKAVQYLPVIRDELRYGVPKIRMEAARALGNMSAQEAESQLLFSLADPAAQVRVAAAEALGMLRSPAAVQPLASVLVSDPDATPNQPEALREAAAAALGSIGESSAREALLHAMRKDPSPTVRIIAGESLALLGDRSGVPLLINFLKSEATGVRRMAAAALGRVSDSSAVESLSYLAVKDSNEDVREAAMKAVEEIRARE